MREKTDEITRAITIVEQKRASLSYTRFILFKLSPPKEKLVKHFRRTPTPFPFRVSFFFSFSADLYRSVVHGSHHVQLVLKRKCFYTSHSRSIDPRIFRPSFPAPYTTNPLNLLLARQAQGLRKNMQIKRIMQNGSLWISALFSRPMTVHPRLTMSRRHRPSLEIIKTDVYARENEKTSRTESWSWGRRWFPCANVGFFTYFDIFGLHSGTRSIRRVARNAVSSYTLTSIRR